MKTTSKSLQKLTTTDKIERLLSSKKPIEISELKEAGLWSPNVYIELYSAICERINELEDVERDEFIERVDKLLPQVAKNQLWEANHNQITAAMANLLRRYNRMPSKNEIARETKISRQTIHKHLNEFKNHPLYIEHFEHFRFLSTVLLGKVYQYAEDGDMGAAKLFFNVLGYLNGNNGNNTLIQNQSNFIQINGIVLSQEAVKKLNPEQLNTIETIVKTALLNKEPVAVIQESPDGCN